MLTVPIPLGHPLYTACRPTFVLKAESYCLEAHMYPGNEIHIVEWYKEFAINELNFICLHAPWPLSNDFTVITTVQHLLIKQPPSGKCRMAA